MNIKNSLYLSVFYILGEKQDSIKFSYRKFSKKYIILLALACFKPWIFFVDNIHPASSSN